MIRTAYPSHRSRAPLAGQLREHTTLLILALVLLGGILLGRYGTSLFGQTVNDTAYRLVAGYSLGNVGEGVGQSFLAAFSSSFALLLGLFFCSFCAIAAPIILGILLLHGVGIGLCYSLFFSVYGMGAFWYVAVILLPNAAITAIVLLRAGDLALGQSVRIYNKIFGDTSSGSPVLGRETVVMFIHFTLMMAGSSALYAATVTLFGVRLAPV